MDDMAATNPTLGVMPLRGETSNDGNDPVARLPPEREIDRHVGARLRQRREALGMSQGALGRRLGITFSQVQKYEKGTNRIGAGRLFRAAAELGVTVEHFFEGLGDPATGTRTKQAAGGADSLRLQDAFLRIADSQARQAVLSLVTSLAAESEVPPGGRRSRDDA